MFQATNEELTEELREANTELREASKRYEALAQEHAARGVLLQEATSSKTQAKHAPEQEQEQETEDPDTENEDAEQQAHEKNGHISKISKPRRAAKNAVKKTKVTRQATSLGEVADSNTLDLERINVKNKRKDPPLTTGRMLPDGTYAMVVQPTGYTDRWCASSCK